MDLTEFYERQDYEMATSEKWGGTETRPFEEWVIEGRVNKAAPYESYWREQLAQEIEAKCGHPRPTELMLRGESSVCQKCQDAAAIVRGKE